MREFIFCGKRLDNGEWVYGSLSTEYQQECGCVMISPTSDTCYKVDPETVGQFTGRKDLNGNKVFENAILQLYTVWADGTREKSAKVIVRWWDNDQCYVLTTKDGAHCDDFGNYGRPEYYEVIGNIHDNPEILEVRE